MLLYLYMMFQLLIRTNSNILQIDESKKGEDEVKEEKDEPAEVKAEEKPGTGPDTDLLSTLASAALEQDPKDNKNFVG